MWLGVNNIFLFLWNCFYCLVVVVVFEAAVQALDFCRHWHWTLSCTPPVIPLLHFLAKWISSSNHFSEGTEMLHRDSFDGKYSIVGTRLSSLESQTSLPARVAAVRNSFLQTNGTNRRQLQTSSLMHTIAWTMVKFQCQCCWMNSLNHYNQRFFNGSTKESIVMLVPID